MTTFVFSNAFVLIKWPRRRSLDSVCSGCILSSGYSDGVLLTLGARSCDNSVDDNNNLEVVIAVEKWHLRETRRDKMIVDIN